MKPTVLITGASTGIGRACALYLAERGFQVFAGVRKPEDGEALKKSAASITPVILDVTDESNISAAGEMVGDAELHGLVNNAGITVPGPLEFVPIDEFRRQLEVNVTGQLAVTQAFLPSIRAAKGRIVFMGSVAGLAVAPFTGPYAASKHALEALTDALRLELMPFSIHVCIIEAGSIKTPIWDKATQANRRVFDNLPAQARRLYEPMLNAVAEITEKIGRRGHPPEKVAAAVYHALTSKRPKTRYQVGRHSYSVKLASQLVPDKMRDFFVHHGITIFKREK